MEERRSYELQAEVYKVLSNPVRLMIMECLREGEKTVSDIATCLKLGKSGISQHLSYMKAVGVLCSRKEGKKVYYYVSDRRIFEALDLFKKVLFERFIKCSQIMDKKF